MEKDDPMSTDVQSVTDSSSDQFKASISSLLASSRGIPSGKDYHFFNNFEEFKLPLRQMSYKSQSLLEKIGASSEALNKQGFPSSRGAIEDDAYDWLVNMNDEIFERVDASLEEYQNSRSTEGEDVVGMEEGGFQMVCRKKKTKSGGKEEDSGASAVKVAENKNLMGKGKVRFHVASIIRPQEAYGILVNNSSEPFQHVWLETSEDGTRYVHPLEKTLVSNFVDWKTATENPVGPLPLVDTPFKYIDDVKDLKLLAKKLQGVKEFAVDLEHNHYRSFQGLTCLIQISTRDEDFILDSLKLKIHIGPHLRDIFKDPSKRKVMHGADRDILWLQRDFGIYVCNLFDTGQASKILNLERNSLEHLLQKFCGVTANKEYQTADWRLRPLPSEMIKYAREDTHYLLQIYDKMRCMLLSMPKENDATNHPLLEVYNRSSEICKQFYEKELLTENSYLYVYGLQDADFNAQQLSVAAGLFGWRDAMARSEDESTGYILPNKTLLEIAKQMPLTTGKLKSLLKSKHIYAERCLNAIVEIVRVSVKNASAFQSVVQTLKESRLEKKKTSDLVEENRDLVAPINEQIPSHFSIEGVNVTVPVSKKPAGAFGALLGNSVKRKSDRNDKEEEVKIEKIRLTFPSIFGKTSMPKTEPQEPVRSHVAVPVASEEDMPPKSEDVIPLENSSEDEGQYGQATLADLSQSFEKCLQPAEQDSGVKFRPFDYAGAPKFWESSGQGSQRGVEEGLGSVLEKDEGSRDFSAPRRRQAFPVTGNRSATFRK